MLILKKIMGRLTERNFIPSQISCLTARSVEKKGGSMAVYHEIGTQPFSVQ